jgi:hypothetical protein
MIFKLIYGVKTAFIKTLENASETDPTFYPDKTGLSRSNVPRVVDGWNYEIREFPAVVITGSLGNNRREGIADTVDTVNFVVLEKSTEGNSATSRIFRVNQALNIGTAINVKNPATTPQEFNVAVENGTGTDIGKKVIQLVGTAVGPDTAYPLTGFTAVSDKPTGDRFGGWFNLSIDIACIGRSTLERERLTDKILSLFWFSKKFYLRDTYNVHIFDVRANGESEEKYGADMLYFCNINITCATEWEEIKWYQEVIEGVDIDADSPTIINEPGN